MIIEISLLLLVLIFTLISAFTDIKWRIVLDYISYSLIIFGIIGNLLLSIFNQTISYFLYSILAALSVFLVGTIFFYLGIWMMGDTKILTGIAASIPFIYVFIFNMPKYTAYWPFILTVWINAIFLAPLLMVIFLFYRIIKNRKEAIPKIREKLYKNKKITLALTFALIIALIFYSYNSKYGIYILSTWAFATLGFYFFIIATLSENLIYEIKKPSELIEGDMPIDLDLKLPEKKGKIIQHNIKKHGLSKSQIEFIQKKYHKTIKIKQGFPMVVAFLASLILSLTLGDLIFLALMFTL